MMVDIKSKNYNNTIQLVQRQTSINLTANHQLTFYSSIRLPHPPIQDK